MNKYWYILCDWTIIKRDLILYFIFAFIIQIKSFIYLIAWNTNRKKINVIRESVDDLSRQPERGAKYW